MPDYVISVQLQRKINAIKAADAKYKKAVFEIAYTLAELADEQNMLLDNAGYKDIVEFATDQFGYARSTTMNYVKIANRYLEGNTKEVRTICAELDDGGTATADYKIGQLNALPGNVDRDEFRRLDAAGIINKTMSADTIKSTLKNYYNPRADPAPAPAPKPEQDPDPEDTETVVPCVTLSIFQIFLNIVKPVIDDFCELGDPETTTATDIFKQFFENSGYHLNWIADGDFEIIGAEMKDSGGNLLYTTNENI